MRTLCSAFRTVSYVGHLLVVEAAHFGPVEVGEMTESQHKND